MKRGRAGGQPSPSRSGMSPEDAVGTRDSSQPLGKRNTAAFDDRPHCPKGKDATAMLGYYNLLPCGRIPPLLMAPGLSYPQKTAMPEYADDLVGSEPWRAAITQPSPRPASRSQAVRDRRAPDTVQWLLGCLRALPPRFRQPTRNRGARGTPPSSRRSRDHVPERL